MGMLFGHEAGVASCRLGPGISRIDVRDSALSSACTGLVSKVPSNVFCRRFRYNIAAVRYFPVVDACSSSCTNAEVKEWYPGAFVVVSIAQAAISSFRAPIAVPPAWQQSRRNNTSHGWEHR